MYHNMIMENTTSHKTRTILHKIIIEMSRNDQHNMTSQNTSWTLWNIVE